MPTLMELTEGMAVQNENRQESHKVTSFSSLQLMGDF